MLGYVGAVLLLGVILLLRSATPRQRHGGKHCPFGQPVLTRLVHVAGVLKLESELSRTLEGALSSFDADGDGVVTLAELRDTLAAQGRFVEQRRLQALFDAATQAKEAAEQAKIAAEEARALVDQTVRLVDSDGDGVISLAEAVSAPRRLLQPLLQQWLSGNAGSQPPKPGSEK